jgi:glutamate dehydrogenase
MSLKPCAGINHKENGVTSEGVNVFLDVSIHHVFKKDPEEEPFTIKITGGPDGDVGESTFVISY